MELRPRQKQAIADLRAAYAGGARAPILVAPTGFGKTATSAQVIRSALERGGHVWFLAHLQELLTDTSHRLHQAGIAHGFIAAGHPLQPHRGCQIVGVQTAARRLDRIEHEWPKPSLIIIDECHLAVASSYLRVIEAAGSPRLLGLSGTPERLDGKGLNQLFDYLVPTCSTGDLIEEGLLAPIRYLAPPPLDLSGLTEFQGEYLEKEAAALLDTPKITGDAIEQYIENCDGRPAVVFCVNTEHAKNVAEAFTKAGYRSTYIDAKSKKAHRKYASEGLKNGELDVVVNVGLWVAGVDIPNIEVVILLRPTKSKTIYLQAIGRGLRVSPGKKCLTVLDHANCIYEHGPPDQRRDWSLQGRQKRKRSGEEAPLVVNCPRCYLDHPPAPRCPHCGHVYHVAPRGGPMEVDGELVEINLKQAQAEYEKRLRKVEQAQAKTFEDLQALGERRGYKPGWAHRVWNERQRRHSYATHW